MGVIEYSALMIEYRALLIASHMGVRRESEDRAIASEILVHKQPYILSKEPYILTKEPYIRLMHRIPYDSATRQ